MIISLFVFAFLEPYITKRQPEGETKKVFIDDIRVVASLTNLEFESVSEPLKFVSRGPCHVMAQKWGHFFVSDGPAFT